MHADFYRLLFTDITLRYDNSRFFASPTWHLGGLRRIFLQLRFRRESARRRLRDHAPPHYRIKQPRDGGDRGSAGE